MESNLLQDDHLELECRSLFWKTLFLSEKLATRILDLTNKQECVTVHSPEYGRIQLQFKKATHFGDNFMSEPCCCYATTENNKHFQAFVKVAPSNILLRAGAFSQRLYFREINVYQYFFSYLRELRCKHDLTQKDLPLDVPEVYFYHLEEPIPGERDGSETVIVLEELKCQGFQMANKFIGCNLHEAQLTLKSLANFHALSIAYLRSIKDSSGNYALPNTLQYLHQRVEVEEKWIENLRYSLPLYLETMKILGYNEAADWLEKQSQMAEIIMKPEDMGQSGILSCILHADCWINNMLFQYNDKGYANEMRLVDWQITRFGHPASDILHFLFSSTSPEMRDQHFDELLTIYYNTMKTGLTKLDINIEAEGYNEEIFRQEVKQRYIWAMLIVLIILPVIVDKTITSSLENFSLPENIQWEGKNMDDLLAESREQLAKSVKSSAFLTNTLLSHWVIQLILQVKKALE